MLRGRFVGEYEDEKAVPVCVLVLRFTQYSTAMAMTIRIAAPGTLILRSVVMGVGEPGSRGLPDLSLSSCSELATIQYHHVAMCTFQCNAVQRDNEWLK
jgi:hypothetical protein